MSNQLAKLTFEPLKAMLYQVALFAVLLVGAGWFSPPVHGQAEQTGPAAPLPMLVRARQADTPSSLALRHLNDASKGWIILEYNGIKTLAKDAIVTIPSVPYRLGGLAPNGFQTVPVLAYADISQTVGDEQRLSPATFSQQMSWLKTEGFTAITPQQLIAFINFSGQLPQKSVLITFDTASQSLYNMGIPILKALGFTATLFVATDAVNVAGAMTWEQIRQLHEDGFTVACQGRSGHSLTQKKDGQTFATYFKTVVSELHTARKTIEGHLKVPCLFLAYPHGKTNSLLFAVAAKLGFSAGFTLEPGVNPFFTDRFSIHRIAIDNRTTPEQFGSALTTMIKADLK